MARMSGAEIVVRALEDEGVSFTFGIPGTHNIELYDALAGSRYVRPILVTDEQSASFMADGLSRSSDDLGCVNLVPGAGLTHALSGVAEAYLDGIPMLVLACGIRADSDHAFQLHDVDQLAIAAPVTKAQLRPQAADEIYATVRRACRLARRPPGGPVIVEIPANYYLLRHPVELVPPEPEAPRPEPDPGDLARVRERLAASRRPLLYLGLGAAGAGRDLVTLAERLEAPVSTTFQGKGVFPETHPLWLWPGFGPTAPPALRKVARDCDLVLAIGCRFSEVGTGSYGFEMPGPLIHVDVDARVLGKNYEAEIAVVSDAAAFVSRLLPELSAREHDPGLREHLREAHAGLWAGWRDAEVRERVPPPRLLQALQAAFGPGTIYATDSGNGTFLALECLRLDRPGCFLAPVDYSCMGYSVPAALGAALANPDRHVVALAGDGAFLMTGLELLTAAQNDLPVAVLVLRDEELAQIAQFQRTAFARTTAARLPDFDLEALSRGIGVRYLEMNEADEIEPVLQQCLSTIRDGEPVLVNVAIDYSSKTYFTRGVVRTTFGRLPWAERLRYAGRALARRLPGLGD